MGNLIKHYDYRTLSMTAGTSVYKQETIPSGYTAVGAFVNYAPSDNVGVMFVKQVSQSNQTVTIRLDATTSATYYYANVMLVCAKS